MENKSAPLNTIEEYIAQFPDDIQDILQKIRATIRAQVPDAQDAIRYQIPTLILGGKNLVHFAAFKNHIGFYPTPNGMEEFKEDLAGYVQGKGSVQFPLDQPIPYELITRIVQFRVQENQKKIQKKK